MTVVCLVIIYMTVYTIVYLIDCLLINLLFYIFSLVAYTQEEGCIHTIMWCVFMV